MNTVRSSLFLLAAIATGCGERNPKAVSMPPPTVFAALPVERDVRDYQIFTARTQAVQSVAIKARVTGYLTKINFVDGQIVKKDDVLFEIDDRPYKAALDQAKADVEFAKAALVKTQADYDIALNVKKQDAGAISKEDLNKALGARDQSQGTLDKAKAAVEQATLNFNWCKVASPIDGRTNTHFVDVGNLVSQDTTTLTNVVSLKPIWAYFDVDENTAEKMNVLVREGKLKSVRAHPVDVDFGLSIDDGSFPFAGKIDFVSNQIDPNTASIRCRAVFANDKNEMIAGQFGRIRVPMDPEHKALLVNDRAIGSSQNDKFVLVLTADNKVESRIVKTGQLHGGLREVYRTRTVTETGADGKGVRKQVEVLKASDRLIVDGLQRVRPGMTVSPTMVDMTTLMVDRPGGAAPAPTPKTETPKVEPVKTDAPKTETPKAEPVVPPPPAAPKLEPVK